MFWHAAPNRPSAANRVCLLVRPGPAQARLDVGTNHAPQDLRGGEILLGTQSLKHRLLLRIDQDRQTSGALFDRHVGGALRLHANDIV